MILMQKKGDHKTEKKGWNNHTESPDNGVVKIARDKSFKKKINRKTKKEVV
jgi:hypothetical protein